MDRGGIEGKNGGERGRIQVIGEDGLRIWDVRRDRC
jgi:hypothetical protein